MKELTLIQSELKAHKGQFNKFGGYKYRSLEDIQEALKPHLAKHDVYVTLSDDITIVGDRVYVKATATIYKNSDPKVNVSVSAFAREPLSKKGMDESQITGAASSYARKYAMNGLFAIDDTQDADATNDHGKSGNTIDDSQIKVIEDTIKSYGVDKGAFLNYIKVSNVSEIKQSDFNRVTALLNKKAQ